MSDAPSFRILAVCTANQCRSPLVEFALRRRFLARGLPWTAASVGTRAVAGRPPHPSTVRLLRAHGDDLSGWSSTLLNGDAVGSADLILTASVEHRNEIVRVQPDAAARTFLLRQLAAYCAAHPGGLVDAERSGSDLTDWISEARTTLPPAPGSMDLPDPSGRSYRTFRRLDAAVEEAVRLLV